VCWGIYEIKIFVLGCRKRVLGCRKNLSNLFGVFDEHWVCPWKEKIEPIKGKI